MFLVGVEWLVLLGIEFVVIEIVRKFIIKWGCIFIILLKFCRLIVGIILNLDGCLYCNLI